MDVRCHNLRQNDSVIIFIRRSVTPKQLLSIHKCGLDWLWKLFVKLVRNFIPHLLNSFLKLHLNKYINKAALHVCVCVCVCVFVHVWRGGGADDGGASASNSTSICKEPHEDPQHCGKINPMGVEVKTRVI
jgi:hypothetical protein